MEDKDTNKTEKKQTKMTIKWKKSLKYIGEKTTEKILRENYAVQAKQEFLK